MRKLKYIKLFESFESIKLSKTLGFIDSNSKRKFLGRLSKLANSIDFPMSQFTDDLFEYLPFNKALKRNTELKEGEKIPCPYESEWIPGEFCKGGKVKRTWGRKTRMIECPKCKGKGYLEPKIKHPVGLIKFWFNKDGEYITSTAVNGEKVKQKIDYNLESLSKNIKDYNIIKDLKDIKEFETGNMVLIKLEEDLPEVIGYVYKGVYFNTSVYIYQDVKEKLTSNLDPKKEGYKFGKYAYHIRYNDDFISAKLIEPKSEFDYYSINIPYRISYGRIDIDKDNNVRSILKEAHFALILDWDKLKQKEFTKKSDIEEKRSLDKEGALFFKSDEDIRRSNIEGYMDKLIDTYSFDERLKDFNRLLSVAFNRFPLNFLFDGDNINYILYILDDLYKVLKNKNPEDNKHLINDINFYVKRIFESSRKKLKLENNVKKTQLLFKTKIGSEPTELLKKQEKTFNMFNDINYILSQKIRSWDVETVEDVEIYISKLKSIRTIIDRLNLYEIKRVYGGWYDEIYYGYINNVESYNVDDILERLEKLKKIIIKI